jgi:hypothetical protein
LATVFIVTTGSYSDYRICRVFLDQKKAEDYSRTKPGSEIEEWETDDDKDLGLFKTVTATLEILLGGYRNIDVQIEEHSVLDTDKAQVETSLYFDDKNNVTNPRELLEIKRLVPSGKSDEEIQRKFERVIEDLYAQIKGLRDGEGWTEEMIDGWLENQSKLVE